jgi:hypothetical protein
MISRSVMRAAACLLAAGLVTVAGTSVAHADDGRIDVRVVENTDQRIVLSYDFESFEQGTARIGDAAFTTVSLGDESLKTIAGAPDLPDVSRSVLIPGDAKMNVRLVSGDFYEIKDIDIAPSKGHILRTTNPADVPYTFGDVYEQDAFFPATPVEARDPYILRDQRGMVVTANPFQYNPVTRTLRVYTSMTVEVVADGAGEINTLEGGRDLKPSRSFAELFEHHFINFESGRYDQLDEEGDMLIICHDAWLPNIQPFADHKNSIGISTTVVGVSTIGNNSTSIKNYIQNVYNSSNLAFVLLVGDEAQVRSMTASGGHSDPSYAKLAGGDDYPEVLVGRFSAATAGQVDTQVLRSVEYEQNESTQTAWFKKGAGVASNQGPGDDGEYDDEHMDVIRNKLLDAGYTEVDQIYDPYATAGMVTTALNDGRGIVNYCGHGSPTSWGSSGFSNSHIDALTNDNMLPFIVTVACNNGEFGNYGTCFAEAWMRATNGGEPTGAVAIYASSISQSWDPPMCAEDEVVDRFLDETYTSVGTLFFAGSCQMMDEYGGGGVDMFNTWIIFGDPSLCVVGTTAPPTGMRVNPGAGLSAEGVHGGPFAPDSITYTLTNFDPMPISFTVESSAPWVDVDVTSGTIPVAGTADVVVSLTGAVNDFDNGYYTAVVNFVNQTNHDGDCERGVELTVGVPIPIHVYDLDTSPGWTMNGQWAFGQPTGQGGTSFGNADPTGGATGNNVYGINLNGDYSTAQGPPQHLTTMAIDCSDLYDCELHFKRWLNSDYQPFVTQTLSISTDGTSWSELWDNGTSEVSDNTWMDEAFDIASHADGEATVYVRWSHQVTSSGAWAYSGWNIDDVEIWGIPLNVDDCPADLNGDDVVDLADLGILLASYNADGGGDIDGDGDTDLADLGEMLAMYGQPCP